MEKEVAISREIETSTNNDYSEVLDQKETNDDAIEVALKEIRI